MAFQVQWLDQCLKRDPIEPSIDKCITLLHSLMTFFQKKIPISRLVTPKSSAMHNYDEKRILRQSALNCSMASFVS